MTKSADITTPKVHARYGASERGVALKDGTDEVLKPM